MGWTTKQKYWWEIKRMLWPILSIMAFLPLPIHLFPIGMIVEGYKAKVRSWVGVGIFFLVVEAVILILYLLTFKHFSLSVIYASLTTLIAYVACYTVGNIILLTYTKPYLKRMELSLMMDLEWVNTPNGVKKWQPKSINSPQTYISQLLIYRNEIANAKIKNNIDRIIHYFRVILDRDQDRAELLVVRHQTILTLLGQYKSIQTSRIYNEVTVASRNDIEKTLDQAVVAVEKEVTNHYEAEILEVSAEKDVYLQQLKNRDLLK